MEQLVAHLAHNQEVGGSSPLSATNANHSCCETPEVVKVTKILLDRRGLSAVLSFLFVLAQS